MVTDIFEIALKNQQQARRVIDDTRVVSAWQAIGAEVNLVGSLKTGLLMTHRDIDFHIYTPRLNFSESFSAVSKLADNEQIKQVQYVNLKDTDEDCLEWHAWYEDEDKHVWQIDMIHIRRGSAYDGMMEKVAARILEILTPHTKETILRLKYETPQDVKIMGIEYCKAVFADGVRTYDELTEWRRSNPVTGVLNWIP